MVIMGIALVLMKTVYRYVVDSIGVGTSSPAFSCRDLSTNLLKNRILKQRIHFIALYSILWIVSISFLPKQLWEKHLRQRWYIIMKHNWQLSSNLAGKKSGIPQNLQILNIEVSSMNIFIFFKILGKSWIHCHEHFPSVSWALSTRFCLPRSQFVFFPSGAWALSSCQDARLPSDRGQAWARVRNKLTGKTEQKAFVYDHLGPKGRWTRFHV